MSPAKTVQVDDLPSELMSETSISQDRLSSWQGLFKQWASQKALTGEEGVLADVVSEVEYLLMDVALEKTLGKRQEAAKLLGWGRNTLTRKLKDRNK
jgi:two-component system nitrogen regulation response regulator GlnG